VRVNNDLSFAELAAVAVAAEQAGFDQLWFSNDLFLRRCWPERWPRAPRRSAWASR